MDQNPLPPIPIELIEAAKEIQAVLEKYDFAGVAVIHAPAPDSPGMLQYVAHLGPSYSCVEFRENKLHVKPLPPPVLVMLDRPALNEDRGKRKAAATVNMLANMAYKIHQIRGLLVQAEMAVRTRFKIAPPLPPNVNGKKPGGPHG